MSDNKKEIERLLKECNELLNSFRKYRLEYIEEVNNKKQKLVEKEKLAKYQIKIIGLAKTDYTKIQELDGISCQDEFVEYMNDSELKNKLISGYLQFEIINDKLYSINTYKSIEKLNDYELLELGSYTQGQWSDGIGEGFEQNSCYCNKYRYEVYISPWYYGQEIKVIQEEIKDSVPS